MAALLITGNNDFEKYFLYTITVQTGKKIAA